MKIELYKNIFWDTQVDKQEDVTLEWINENIFPKLGVDDSDEEFIAPELDRYGRPYKWIYEGENYKVEITREYISPAKWAKKGDIVKIFEV